MLVGSAVVSWIAIVLYTFYTNKYFGYSFKDQLKDIKPSILFSLGIAIPVYLISFIILTAFLLRIDDILYYPLWTDEVYTKTVAIKNFFSFP